MIDERAVESAIDFIRDESERLGLLVGHCKGLEQIRKVVHGQAFLDASGTVAEREAKAYSSPEYKVVAEDIEDAWAKKTELETLLKARELRIDVWRSQNSSRNKGHV